jgi:tRNA(Glu) U13 pseudouridine synthase TruD
MIIYSASSLHHMKENIGFIVVKFALHDGSFATVLLDYFSARARDADRFGR